MMRSDMRRSPHARARAYFTDENGVSAVEFVAISLPFIALLFVVIEVAFAYYLIESSQKAAQIGARLAIVSSPAVVGMPSQNVIAAGGEPNGHCSETPSHCATPAPSRWVCDGGVGGACAPEFYAIVSAMQGVLAGIQPRHVTVSYAYSALGRAQGPLTPSITVQVSGVENPLRWLAAIRGAFYGDQNFDTIPTVRAVYSAEDLSSPIVATSGG